MGICNSKLRQEVEEKNEQAINKNLFSLYAYESIKEKLKNKIVYRDDYRLFAVNIQEEFYRFGLFDTEFTKKVGWKAHISIDDSSEENLAHAWDILKDVFIEYRLQVKVIQPKKELYKDMKQHGKQITIYCYMTPNIKWEEVFNQIEILLINASIRPDRRATTDREIPNSNFITYRNDDDGTGNYIESATSYNPSNAEDPFINIRLESKTIKFSR